jgi:hypothetical protein
MLMQNLDYSPYVHFKSPLQNDWCMFIKFHLTINIFIKFSILIHKYVFQIDDFTMRLWHLNEVNSVKSP